MEEKEIKTQFKLAITYLKLYKVRSNKRQKLKIAIITYLRDLKPQDLKNESKKRGKKKNQRLALILSFLYSQAGTAVGYRAEFTPVNSDLHSNSQCWF